MILKSFSINRLITVVIACGFLFLFIETLIEHQDVLPHERPAFIPIIVSLIGFIISLITVQGWKESLISLLRYYFIITLLAGAGGLFFHNEPRFEQESTDTEMVVEDKEDDGQEAPILAPAAFIGLAIIGLIGTGRKRECEIRQKA